MDPKGTGGNAWCSTSTGFICEVQSAPGVAHPHRPPTKTKVPRLLPCAGVARGPRGWRRWRRLASRRPTHRAVGLCRTRPIGSVGRRHTVGS
eukprot:9185219-Pyramimonas_sp.AAC.1